MTTNSNATLAGQTNTNEQEESPEDRVRKYGRITFEYTLMAYQIPRALKMRGYSDIAVAHPKTLAWTVRSSSLQTGSAQAPETR